MLIFSLIALALVIGTLILVRHENKLPALICAGLLLLLALGRPFLVSSTDQKREKFDNRVRQVMSEVLAKTVMDRHPDARIAFIVGPEVADMSKEREMKHSLEPALLAAFQAKGVEPIRVPLPLMKGMQARLDRAKQQPPGDKEHDFSPEMAYFTAMMHDVVQYSARQINTALLAVKGKADVVIWTLDLSMPIVASQLLNEDKGPVLVLINAKVEDLEEALRSTVLDIHLENRQGGSWDLNYSWPKDVQEAFDDRFVLNTRDE